jgi:mRNA interferase MazF
MNNALRGEIWLIDWNPSRGSEQSGFRPSVVIQSDKGNCNPKFPNTVVVCISKSGKEIPFHIKLIPDNINKLTEISYIKGEQIMTISKERLVKKIGKITEKELLDIEKAVKRILSFN